MEENMKAGDSFGFGDVSDKPETENQFNDASRCQKVRKLLKIMNT
jgi:hypothetical protein